MYPKKIAAMAAIMAVCIGFSACSGNGDGGSAESSSASTASDAPTITGTVSETVSEDSSADNTETEVTDVTGEAGETSDDPLLAAAESAIDGMEWPAMAVVSNDEKEFISDFFLLDTENGNYKDLFIMQCPMSANLSEIIIIEADDVTSAKADLEARQKKAQEQDAFYPDDVERAGASIVGTYGTYAYFIMGNNSGDVEKALTAGLK